MRRATLLSWLVLACTSPPRAMPPPDLGPDPDASRPDAETPDFGGDDAGPMDLGPPDLPTVCSERCDPVAQTGCPDETTTCVLQREFPTCRSGGVLPRGSVCGTTDACAPGLACFFDEGGVAVCSRVCCALDEEDPACTPDEECGGTGLLVDGTQTTFGRCRPPTSGCDVLDREGCGLGEACYLADGTTRCFRAGTADEGEPCRLPQDCSPQQSCVGFFSARCRRVCDLAADVPCPGDGACTRFAQSPPGTGLCVPTAPEDEE